jgi:arginine/ornithine transport system permease protein
VPRARSTQYYLPFEAYITAGVFYLCLTFILVRLFKMAERRWRLPGAAKH